MLDSMKRQLNELREDLHLKEQEQDHFMKRQSEEERDRNTQERKDKSRLQKELETLERSYMELEQQRKADVMAQQTEYENLQRQHRVVMEERNIYLQKMQALQIEIDQVKKNYQSKVDEFDLIEREYQKL